MDPAAWDNGFPGFGLPHTTQGQSNEDWEEWLRWDPAAEAGGDADATSPEDGTAGSTFSSKNDSPIQDSVLPANLFFPKDETLAPPLVVGEDGSGYGVFGHAVDDASLLFGGASDGAAFDFQTDSPSRMLSAVPSGWPVQETDLSVLVAENHRADGPSSVVPSNSPSLLNSPESSGRVGSSISSNSPDPLKKRGGRKRKVDAEREAAAEAAEQNGDSNEDDNGDEPPAKKTSHNVIEKRYRNNLNDKIVELRNSVPSLRALGRANRGKDTEDLEGLTPAHKLNKATVMAKATEYIRHLEKRNKGMVDEMATLKARLAAVEAAIGKSADRQPSVSTPSGQQSFLGVAQDQQRFVQQAMPQHFQQAQSFNMYQPQAGTSTDSQFTAQPQQQQQTSHNRGRSGALNKAMLGAMAGLMVMEGFSEQQAGDSNTRGLSALPLHLLKRDTWASPASTHLSNPSQAILPLLKVFLVVSALLYVLAPLLTFSPRRKQKLRPIVRLPHAPSLASPIELRRKAWLTAIQTVWVPKHFLLEVVSVTVKMISLSVRRLIGSQAYSSLTGTTPEEECARIKAWDIAIDAQLAGGDAEVSYYRLLLTLMESGTLPDSPTRLMQKAVHFRVFFWEVANAGYGNMIGFKQFTERVGKVYWDSARRQQRELAHAASQGRPRDADDDDDSAELLPDHLASLVELDCDEVLGDEMIQRAWNLAWNKPSAHKTLANGHRDAVVEDHTIRSPLDAVAAWYANMTIDETLVESISDRASKIDTEYYIALAVAVSPRASATQARALAAKAVLSTSNREKNVLAALDALPVDTPASAGGMSMNNVPHLPVAPDVRLALTLAKLLSLLSTSAPATARLRALQSISKLHIPPASFTLLTAIASHRLLKALIAERNLSPELKRGIEELAAGLRVWTGTAAGRAAGLDRAERARVIELCLAVAKRVGGWSLEKDSGYGSADGSPVRERRDVPI